MLCVKLLENFVFVQQTKGDKLQTRVEDLLEQRHKLQKAVDELKVRALECVAFFSAILLCAVQTILFPFSIQCAE